MINKIKRGFLHIFIIACLLSPSASANVETSSPSYTLTDLKTGQTLLAKNEHEKRPIASVTKVMTMLLITEELDSGNLKLDQTVRASEIASKMGGSQIYLKANEELTVDTMLKSIAVASANDCAAAMAEQISGSISAFVEKMNNRAKELGMNDTHFKNPHGLDEDGHYSSAFDVAVMSRELLKHDSIKKYTTIWQEKIRNGSFELTNTNKMIRFYEGATGLKTGSTSQAGYCLSASAKRDNLELIAVELGADSSNNRFADAKSLLDYGFANYKLIGLTNKKDAVAQAEIFYGKKPSVDLYAKDELDYLLKTSDKEKIEKIITTTPITAPVKAGDTLGKITFSKNGETIKETDLIAADDVPKKTLFDIINEFLKAM